MQTLHVSVHAVPHFVQHPSTTHDVTPDRWSCQGLGSSLQHRQISRGPQLLSSRRSSRLVGHDSASSTWPSEPAEAVNNEEALKQIPENGNGVAKSGINASSDEAALRVGLSSKGSKKLAGFWGAYSKALEEHPIRVKSATSFFGFLFGDVVAQLVVGNPYNYLRTARMVVFGILMDGPVGKSSLIAGISPVLHPYYDRTAKYTLAYLLNRHLPRLIRPGHAGHLWYTFLDGKVYPDQPKSNKAVISKMLCDQLIWAPFFSCVFFTVIKTLEVRLLIC